MNKKGFSIIEVLVATAIMVTTALAIGELLSQFSKFRKYMDASAEFTNFANQIEFMMKGETSCLTALNTTIDPATKLGTSTPKNIMDPLKNALKATKVDPSIPTKPDPSVYAAEHFPFTYQGTTYNTANGKVPLGGQVSSGVLISGFKVGKVELSAFPTSATDGSGQVWNRYYLALIIQGELMKVGASLAESQSAVLGPSYLKVRKVEFAVTLDPTNSYIKSCTTATSAKAICADMGGTWYQNEPDPAKRCDLLPRIQDQLGGCVQGGGFTRESGRCDSPNPATKQCNCPAGFTAMQTSDFTAGGGKSSVSIDIFGCFKCD